MIRRSWLRTVSRHMRNRLGVTSVVEQITEAKMLAARVLINQMRSRSPFSSLSDAEFKVFSQFGDDGIVQYIVHECRIAPVERTFVEFGVQDYEESNTRFLLMNDNWRGLIMDGDERNMDRVRNSNYYWKHDLATVAAFIDRDNINRLLRDNGFNGQHIGLLSIDIDGNDYWIWEQIDAVDPVIVVIEYNSVFGSSYAVTVPYDAEFTRSAAHYSQLYWGCSLRALCKLAERKGYAFVGSNSAGNNAYFVRTDRLGRLRAVSPNEGFVASRFRESRDKAGRLTFLTGDNRLHEISSMPVYDLDSGKTVSIKNLFKLTE